MLERTSVKHYINLPVTKLLGFSIGLWLLLLAFGVYRLHGDVVGALFPLDGRAGVSMWSRGRVSGGSSFGFAVSTASYLYALLCAIFLMLFTFLKTFRARCLILVVISLSLPYFFLMGSRNQVVAVLMPGIFSYLLFSRHNRIVKATILCALFIVIDLTFRIVIGYRNIGFTEVLTSGTAGILSAYNYQHKGLNMASELMFMNQLYDMGVLNLSYGQRYFNELVNFIPRAIWPNKPEIGLDYAILRGYGIAKGTQGSSATISTGAIGQGFVNFGPMFGPIAAAFLMAIWSGILARFWSQRSSLLRFLLFLLGLGLSFNLGRDITLLVLWPMVFAYILVRYIEWRRSKLARRARLRNDLPVAVIAKQLK